MTAHLLIQHHDSTRAIECRGTTTIGRDASSDILIGDRLVSRNHAIIRCLNGDDYYLVDSDSANGSFINGKRITTPTLLRSNDLIAIGPALLTFQHSNQQPRPSDTTAVIASTLFYNRVSIQQIAILVADMRGFTPLAESVPIHILSKIISEWFHNVSTNIQASGGAVEKFIGDCVYARWDITERPEEAVFKALRSALAVQRITEGLNTFYPDLPQKLSIGAGVNIGDAAIGVGQENAAIGDSVNTAFRLESASKELGCDIVIGPDAYALLPRALWAGREHTVRAKGKRDSLRVCGLDFADVERLPGA